MFHAGISGTAIWYAINARGGVHTVFAEVFCAAYCALSSLFAGNPHIQAMLMSVFTLLLLKVGGIRDQAAGAGRQEHGQGKKPSQTGKPRNIVPGPVVSYNLKSRMRGGEQNRT